MKDQPSRSLKGHSADVTRSPRSQHEPASDPVDVIREWHRNISELTVLGRGPSACDEWTASHRTDSVIATDPTYATKDVYGGEPAGVLIGDQSRVLAPVSERFHATPPERRPLLMHMYLPGGEQLAFAQHELPQPIPILPILRDERLYVHQPLSPYPTTGVFALLLAAALGKRTTVAGIDLYQHPGGKAYVNDQEFIALPSRHSETCDRRYISHAIARLGDRVRVHPWLASLLADHHGC